MLETKKEDTNLIKTNISHQLNYSKERLTRTKAIRMKCLDCCAFQPKEVKLCTSYDCPLWRYRTGKEERDELYKH